MASAAVAAAAIPTRRATSTNTCAIVVALWMIAVETADMKVRVAMSRTTAMAIT